MRAREFERDLAALSFWTESEIDQCTRQLRAVGSLPTGGRGLNAPDITAEHAAIILIGLAAARRSKDIPNAVETYGLMLPVAEPFEGANRLRDVLTLLLTSWEQLKYAILPIITLSLVPLGVITRSTRSAIADVLAQDFVQMLRAKGLGGAAVVRHAVRNALPQILAVMGLQFGYLVGGSILIETIFTWPGTGFLLSKAILTRDIPLLQGTILILSLSFVATNLIVDLLQTAVDPRIKRA